VLQENDPEKMIQAVIDACADCDVCRYLMEYTPCLFFPDLYRLFDKNSEQNQETTTAELRQLVDLCNFCGLCPCPNIRSDIMKAKHAFISRAGLNPAIRLLEDVERVAKVCGAYPRLANILLKGDLTAGVIKTIAGIHPERKIPVFPQENFPQWMKRRVAPACGARKDRRVAYFAGCTAQYLFPEVPQAAVEVLEQNQVEVYYPEQKCCGMPTLLEGDGPLTFEFVKFNVERLAEAVDEGFDIVCSCPTCGFMLKHVLGEGASYADAYRESVGRGESRLAVYLDGVRSVQRQWSFPSNTVFDHLFKDEGYFSSIDAVKRMKIAGRTYDLGEYLWNLHCRGELSTDFGRVSGRMTYYPPCHLREQKIGRPYFDLLGLVPGVTLDRIDDPFYCCGIAGIMGFKRGFHETSVQMGSRLMEKVTVLHPERLLTDCLSCRIQFNQLIPYRVFHPIEILNESYANHRA
jgi:glycerol-3-phosphate dehydrogenase subunit C